MTLFNELKRRNVFRVAFAYIVTAWLLIQVADVVLDNIESPPWVFQVILLLTALGMPISIIFAWAFEITPEGLKKEKDVIRDDSITDVTGRKLDFAIIGVLIVAVSYFAADKFMFSPADEASQITATQQSDSPDTEATANSQDKQAAPVLSIAVLPFVNMSSDPEQEFFSDGISEELLNVLAQFPGLRVAARTSSFQFKGQNRDVGEIAAALNVAHILEGSVRKSGTRLRITAQLIKADDGFHIWSATYDRELDDVFAIQDEIAKAIGAALKVKLNIGESGNSTLAPGVMRAANTQAYEAFLRGRQLIHMRGRESLEDAVRHLERSLRLDANYAPAHAQLAIATTLLLNSVGTYGTLTQEEVHRRAIPHIERALELAPNLADVHGAMGLLALHGTDPLETIDHTSRAIALNPSYVDAMNWLQIAYSQLGQYQEAIDITRSILEIDPLSTIGRMNYGGLLLFEDDAEAAHTNANQLMQQNLWAGYTNHADAALQDGRLSDSLRWNLRAYSEDPGDPYSNLLLVTTFCFVREFNEARRVSDTFQFLVDYYEGKNDAAARNTQRRLELDPSNFDALIFAADTMYLTRDFAEAERLYEQLRDFRPAGRTIGDSVHSTIAFAAILRGRGDLIAAQANIEIAGDEIGSLIEQGWDNLYRYQSQALMAAYDDDTEAVAAALRTALDRGSRDPMFIHRPLFDGMRGDERLTGYRDEIGRLLEEERASTKQMMCFDNPVPDAWQPLTETCQGVIRETI